MDPLEPLLRDSNRVCFFSTFNEMNMPLPTEIVKYILDDFLNFADNQFILAANDPEAFNSQLNLRLKRFARIPDILPLHFPGEVYVSGGALSAIIRQESIPHMCMRYISSDIDIFIITRSIERREIIIRQLVDELFQMVDNDPTEIYLAMNNCVIYVFLRGNSNISYDTLPPRIIKIIMGGPEDNNITDLVSKFDFSHLQVAYDGKQLVVLPDAAIALSTNITRHFPQYTIQRNNNDTKARDRVLKTLCQGFLFTGSQYCDYKDHRTLLNQCVRRNSLFTTQYFEIIYNGNSSTTEWKQELESLFKKTNEGICFYKWEDSHKMIKHSVEEEDCDRCLEIESRPTAILRDICISRMDLNINYNKLITKNNCLEIEFWIPNIEFLLFSSQLLIPYIDQAQLIWDYINTHGKKRGDTIVINVPLLIHTNIDFKVMYETIVGNENCLQ